MTVLVTSSEVDEAAGAASSGAAVVKLAGGSAAGDTAAGSTTEVAMVVGCGAQAFQSGVQLGGGASYEDVDEASTDGAHE